MAYRLLEQDRYLFRTIFDGKIDFNNPLIKRSFGTKNETGPSTAVTSGLSYCVSIPCDFSLGIVMLELIERRTIEVINNQYDCLVGILTTPSEAQRPVAVKHCYRRRNKRGVKLAKRLPIFSDCNPNHRKVMKRCIGGLDAAFESLQEDYFRDEVEDLNFYCDKNDIEGCV